MKLNKTKVEQVKEKILNEIVNGSYKQKLPGIRVLAKHYDVHFSTVHRALEMLKNEGYLVRFHGSGSFVPPDKRIQSAGILLFRKEAMEFSELSLEVVCALAEKLLVKNINLQIYSVVEGQAQDKFIGVFKETVDKMDTDLVITFRIPPFINVEDYIDKPVIQISSQYELRNGYFITAEGGWVLANSLKLFLEQGIDEIGVILPDQEIQFGEEIQGRVISVLQKVSNRFSQHASIEFAPLNRLPKAWHAGKLPKGLILYHYSPTVEWLERTLVELPDRAMPKLVFIGDASGSGLLDKLTLCTWHIPLEDFIAAILQVINNIVEGKHGCHTYILVNSPVMP